MTTVRAEDYLEAIDTIVRRKGYAKVKDVARILDVGLSSVTGMFQKLSDEGFVNYEKYSGVTLTPKGKRIANELKEKHNTLKEFFLMLGISDEIADEDACKIEHAVNTKTMERLTKFVEFVRDAPEHPIWLKHFKHFYETGERLKCERREKK